MKVAVVYNRESQRVINPFGTPNREKYGVQAIKRLTNALKEGGHTVRAFEGDKDLIDHLEEFMPRVLQGERPGMVFNVAYGIQGHARYTHVPSILEMVGLPYVGSGPLAHSLALDKVVTKMIMQQHGLPTPDYAVLEPGFATPDLPYPLIVKPRNEAVSFGLRVVHNEQQLREAAQIIFDQFQQGALVEQYIDGREINVGLLGNGTTVEAFPPAELVFPAEGERVYSEADKKGQSGRTVDLMCPADIGEALTAEAQELARKVFRALGCHDCARVDMRISPEGKLYLLEVNSLPSLGQRGSYVFAAERVGLDFNGLVNRLVEVASARYFGVPHPPPLAPSEGTVSQSMFSYVTSRRDKLEDRLRRLMKLESHTDDPVGVRAVQQYLHEVFTKLGLGVVEALTDPPHAWTYQSAAGVEGGTLLVVHLDVPTDTGENARRFVREAEWLLGEGIGSSRGPLAVLLMALQTLQAMKKLSNTRLGVFLYADEGSGASESGPLLQQAAAAAGQVLVLRPATREDALITERPGWRTYRLVTEGPPRRPGQDGNKPDLLRWTWQQLDGLAGLSQPDGPIVAASRVQTTSFPLLLPHRVAATVTMTYETPDAAATVHEAMRKQLASGRRFSADLELLHDRPPLARTKGTAALAKQLVTLAKRLEIPLGQERSAWPSVAGLVSGRVPVVCGLGPVAKSLYTPEERVGRTSLVQRSLVLAEFLGGAAPTPGKASS